MYVHKRKMDPSFKMQGTSKRKYIISKQVCTLYADVVELQVSSRQFIRLQHIPEPLNFK